MELAPAIRGFTRKSRACILNFFGIGVVSVYLPDYSKEFSVFAQATLELSDYLEAARTECIKQFIIAGELQVELPADVPGITGAATSAMAQPKMRLNVQPLLCSCVAAYPCWLPTLLRARVLRRGTRTITSKTPVLARCSTIFWFRVGSRALAGSTLPRFSDAIT